MTIGAETKPLSDGFEKHLPLGDLLCLVLINILPTEPVRFVFWNERSDQVVLPGVSTGESQVYEVVYQV